MDENLDTEKTTYTSKLEERVVFFFVCVGIIALTYVFFFIIDFLPEKPEQVKETKSITEEITPSVTSLEKVEETIVETSTVEFPLPLTIIFDSLDGKEVNVVNPESDSVAVLDEALLSGVVRHPNSADFENTGTMFLLGHSSYLPSVRNKNFQAFNGIQKLVWGDTIRLRSGDREYIYSVNRVYEVKASVAEVPIIWGEPMLVLSTCNSFGTKDDRFVVEASLVESYML